MIDSLETLKKFLLGKFGGMIITSHKTKDKRYHGPVAYKWVLNGTSYWILFKAAPFYEFSKYFPGETGKGQTLNLELLKRATNDESLILIAGPDEKFWVRGAYEWLKYAKEHGTIRRPSTEIGDEASIPLDFLLPWGEVQPL